jgi:arabinogalactan endo-1,4-beta-galactosidase
MPHSAPSLRLVAGRGGAALRRCVLVCALAALSACVVRGARPAPAAFILGADMSYVGVEDCDGACPVFRESAESAPEDVFAMLASAGVTTVRLRLWNNPVASESYANLTGVLGLARRVRGAGLQVWLDLHMSDTWADPGHQFKPGAWASLPAAELEAAVYNWTLLALGALSAQGTTPQIVQVGNEINNGMLWSAPGQPCGAGGNLSSPCEANFPVFASFVRAGLQAVTDACPSCLRMVHSAQGSGLADPGGVQAVVDFFSGLLSAGAQFDLIGLSFYPHWGAGNSTNIALLAQVAAALPDLAIVIAETAYQYEDGPPGGGQFPSTPAGQLAYLQSAIQQVRALPDQAGVGLAWWGTEYVNGSGAGMTALWDTSYVALPALLQGWRL